MGLLEDKELLLQLLKLPPTASVADMKAKFDSGQTRFLEIGKQVSAKRDDIDRLLKGIEANFLAARNPAIRYLNIKPTWKNLQAAAKELGFPSPHGVTYKDVLDRWGICIELYKEKKTTLTELKKKSDAEKERYKELKKHAGTVKKVYFDFFHQLKIQSGLNDLKRQLGVDDLKKFDEVLKEEKLKEEKEELKEEKEELKEEKEEPTGKASPPQKNPHSSLPSQQFEGEKGNKGSWKVGFKLGNRFSLNLRNGSRITYHEATIFPNIFPNGMGQEKGEVYAMVFDDLAELVSFRASMDAHDFKGLHPGRYFCDDKNSRHILLYEKSVGFDNVKRALRMLSDDEDDEPGEKSG